MSMPTLRLRDQATGKTMQLPSSVAVEVLDAQGNIALLLLPDPIAQGLKVVTAIEEAEVAAQYGQTHHVEFSQLITPALAKLIPS